MLGRRSFLATIASLIVAPNLPLTQPKDVVPVMLTPGEFVVNKKSLGYYGSHINNINITRKLARQSLYELCRKRHYFRYMQFPVQITNYEVK